MWECEWKDIELLLVEANNPLAGCGIAEMLLQNNSHDFWNPPLMSPLHMVYLSRQYEMLF